MRSAIAVLLPILALLIAPPLQADEGTDPVPAYEPSLSVDVSDLDVDQAATRVLTQIEERGHGG